MVFQCGDIILVHGEHVFSELIQNVTDSFYSHAALCVDEKDIVEMLRYGLVYGPNRFVKGKSAYVVLRHKNFIHSSRAQVRELTNKMAGCIEEIRSAPPKYDFMEIIRLGMVLIGKKGKNLFRGAKGYSQEQLLQVGESLICSALVDKLYQCSGIDLLPDKAGPRSTTPADLAGLTRGDKAQLEVVQSYLPIY